LANNVYECLFILDSNRYARDPHAVSGTLPGIVQNLGGEVLANRLWTEQKLAYPIRGHRKGTYWLTYFRLDSGKVGEFNRACQLNENILRNLVVRVEPRLVDVLVSHALGKRATPVEATPATTPAAPATASVSVPVDAPEKEAEAGA
jgi:small subunit ribosomal protein S6